MTSRPRHRLARAPRVEALEGRALLTIVTIYPFGHPDRARQVNIPDATSPGANGTSSPANGTGASSGISGGTTSSEPAGNSAGSATGAGGTSSGAGGAGGGSASATVLKERFHERKGHADYTLSERAGGVTFTSSFTFDTRRVGSRPAAASVTPASAFGLFVNRLAAKAAPVSTAPATGSLPSAGDYTIQKETVQARGNRSTYDLTIRSGDVQVAESYTLTTTGSGSGSFNQAAAFTDFVQRFSARSGGTAANSGSL